MRANVPADTMMSSVRYGKRCSRVGFSTSLLADQVKVAVSMIAEFIVIVWLELNPV